MDENVGWRLLHWRAKVVNILLKCHLVSTNKHIIKTSLFTDFYNKNGKYIYL